MSEHKWKFGDWGREHGYLIRYVGMHDGMLRFIWPDGSTGRRSNDSAIEYLPDCTGWDWKYRPFANGEEFKPFRDLWVRWKGSNETTLYCIHAMSRDVVSIGGQTAGTFFSEALATLEFEDGTPFGLPVSEDDK